MQRTSTRADADTGRTASLHSAAAPPRALLLAAALLAASASPPPPPSALAAFAASLRGQLLTAANGSAFAAASAEWNTRCAAEPLAVAFAAGEADVAASLAYARAWALPLALRARRHLVECWSVAAGGLVLDVSAGFGAVSVDAAARTAVVGAGVSMGGFLNATVAPFGLHAPAGSCSTVGAAGFTSGGGIGWTSRLFGLSADNVLSVRAVLANGTAADFSPADADPRARELFWALAGGGGGNFAVVSSFTMRLWPLPPALLYAEFAFPWAFAPNASALYVSLFGEPRFCFYLLLVSPTSAAARRVRGGGGAAPAERAGAAAASPLALLQGIWVGDLAEGRAVLARLTALAVAANASGAASARIVETDYLTACRLFEGPLATPTAGKQKSAFLPAPPSPPPGAAAVPPALSEEGLALIGAWLAAAPPDVADNSALYANMMGGAVNERGPGDTPFPHRNALCNFVLDAHWVDSATTPAALAWAGGFFGALEDGGFVPRPGTPGRGTYVNYADADLESWQQAYYGLPNYARLQRVKSEVDGSGLFGRFPQGVELPPPAPPRAAALENL